MDEWKKPQSTWGKFLSKHKIPQERVREDSHVGRETISKAAKLEGYKPNRTNQSKLTKSTKKLSGKDVTESDFW